MEKIIAESNENGMLEFNNVKEVLAATMEDPTIWKFHVPAANGETITLHWFGNQWCYFKED